MPVITIRDIPNELYNQIKESADSQHRSMNNEILSLLEKEFNKKNTQLHLNEIRQLREKTIKSSISTKDIKHAIARENH